MKKFGELFEEFFVNFAFSRFFGTVYDYFVVFDVDVNCEELGLT